MNKFAFAFASIFAASNGFADTICTLRSYSDIMDLDGKVQLTLKVPEAEAGKQLSIWTGHDFNGIKIGVDVTPSGYNWYHIASSKSGLTTVVPARSKVLTYHHFEGQPRISVSCNENGGKVEL